MTGTAISLPLPTMPLAPSTNLDEMYREHHRMVFSTAYRVTGNAHDAEDVLHTVFLRLLRRDESVIIGNPESYLRRSAVNAALDVVRARRDSHVSDLERVPARSRDLDLSDLSEHLRRALASLPERTAAIFVLRFFEGLSNPEIAKAMGMSQMVVAVTVHRARKKLQLELRKAGVKP
jgi:RNA polymerase sigma-70 factor, ECF subfamily